MSDQTWHIDRTLCWHGFSDETGFYRCVSPMGHDGPHDWQKTTFTAGPAIEPQETPEQAYQRGRADTLRQVEQEARRRVDAIDKGGPRSHYLEGHEDAYTELADWCQQQREGR